jgi:hypothetical protein
MARDSIAIGPPVKCKDPGAEILGPSTCWLWAPGAWTRIGVFSNRACAAFLPARHVSPRIAARYVAICTSTLRPITLPAPE